MKPIIIGQAPGPNTDPMEPLHPLPSTGTGGRLLEVMGISPEDYLAMFRRTNLLHCFPGQWRKEDRWPKRDAVIAAQAIKPLLERKDVILVGRRVAVAFGYRSEDLGFHQWYEEELWGYRVAIVPHTSGRSHWYRREENLKQAQAFWNEYLGSRGFAAKLLVGNF